MSETANLSQVVFKLSSKELAREIRLSPETWRILSQINGTRSVAEIAQSIEMDAATVTRIVDTLYKEGLLEVASGSVAPSRATVDGNFFEQVNRELTWAIGPVAEIIIAEEINALGETRESFPRSRISEFVERVSAAVGDETEAVRFQKIMLEAIRKL